MFEEIRLGQGGDSIIVETRRKTRIRNSVEPEPGDRERRKYELMRAKFGKQWHHRKAACGVYNCYGMIFASRRTAILEDDQILRILQDDGYRRISESEVMVGDLVLYRGRTVGLMHVSQITRRDDGLGTLHALSKWDSTSGEDEHHVRHHCWTADGFEVELEFWTDRP